MQYYFKHFDGYTETFFKLDDSGIYIVYVADESKITLSGTVTSSVYLTHVKIKPFDKYRKEITNIVVKLKLKDRNNVEISIV